MFPLFLIFIFSYFVYYSTKVMIKRGHDLYALSFFVLYIYSIFTQITYAFSPEILDDINLYYGSNLFYSYWFFMFFSFVMSFLIYKKFVPVNSKSFIYPLAKTKKKYGQYLFFIITFLLYSILVFYFNTNRSSFGYSLVSDSGISLWFNIGFGLFTICTLILYTIFRNKSNRLFLRRFSGLLFLVSFLFILSVLLATGARSGILYFFIAISFYELFPIKNVLINQKKKVVFLLLVGFIVFNVLSIIFTLRGTSTDEINFFSIINNTSKNESSNFVTTILTQDYLLPSHLLFISMEYKAIDPIETLKSNLSNSLVLLNYPLLSHYVTSKTNLFFKRTEGWGYHLFVEGYNAMGWLGIFYNSIIWNLGMALIYRFSRSNNREVNKIMLSISVLYIIAIMRAGQSFSFIKTSWMFLLPALALLLLANNLKPVKFKKNLNV